MTERATQGHRYHWHGLNVLATESGTDRVRVRLIEDNPGRPSTLGQRYYVTVKNLIPQPMRYFHNQVPR